MFPMKRMVFAFPMVLGVAVAAWAATPAPLTNLRDIRALTNAEAKQTIPVDFEATVTYFRDFPRTLFVQEGDAAIYVLDGVDTQLVPGDRVRVRGVMKPSFRPIVQSKDITLLGHGTSIKPVPATYSDLINIRYLCRLVTIRATIRSADLRSSWNESNIYLHMMTDDGALDASVLSKDESALDGLLDAEVEVSGVGGVMFDSKMQQTGVIIHVNSMADVKVLQRAKVDPWTLPIKSMDTIRSSYRLKDLSSRVRVRGTVTYFQPGGSIVIQDGDKSLWIDSETYKTIRVGDVVDAVGFPDVHDGFLRLTRGEIQRTGATATVTPHSATWQSLTSSDNIRFGHVYDLVSINGQVVTEAREATRDIYVINSDGRLFTAIYYHLNNAKTLLPMKQTPIGATVRVTGICIQLSSNPWNGPVPFEIVMRSFDDITIVAKPTLLNTRNLIIAVSLLLLMVIAVSAWGWTLRSKVHQQTSTLATMAQYEQQRSLILEKINGADPLAGILEDISGLVSSILGGAPCWCEIAGGSKHGEHFPQPGTLRVSEMRIEDRAGATLGSLHARLDPVAIHSVKETEALKAGVRLAALAIETRRLYSDLRRRSEFDLLTDIPNRFAMAKFINARIEEARQTSSLLGLIYIDLDKFKQINDTYGHHAGDLYLQQVALRMSHQLLGGDMLARLGGDEFAAVVSLQHGRSDLDKILARLKSCFDEPFSIEGILLHGEASIGIALYPEDGATEDSLLSAADSAMYKAKHTRKQFSRA